MEKWINEITNSTVVYPTSTTGISGSTGVKMDKYREAFIKATLHRLPDDKGTGVATLSAYQNTQSAWGGAVAITNSVATATLNSGSDIDLQIDVRSSQMSVNADMTHLNCAFVLPTGALVEAQIYRSEPRYKPQDS